MRSLLIVSLVVASMLAGCSHKQTVNTSNGPATVRTSDNNKTVTVTTNEGSATYGEGIDASKVGLPIYPGATTNEGGVSANSARGSGETVALITSDSFDKVYAWYQTHMPKGSEKMHMSGQSGSIATFQEGAETDKEQRTVMITADKDKTSIILAHTVKP